MRCLALVPALGLTSVQRGAHGRVNTKNVPHLLDRLLSEDNMDVKVPMPVQAGGPNVVVLFDLAMNKLVHYNQEEGVARFSIYYRLFWNDERLLFNGTEDVGPTWTTGKDSLTVREESIWTPVVVPYYSIDDEFTEASISVYDVSVLREKGYNLLWSRPAVVNVHCDTNLVDFPFDTQECTLIVGPWSNMLPFGLRAKRRADEESASFVGQLHSEEWQLMSTHFRNVSQLYVTGPAEEVHYTVAFRRYAHYYLINAILPMMLVVALSTLTMWLPIDGGSGERLGFSVTLLLTIMAMALFTAESRPATREETWLDRFQAWSLILTFFPVAESVLVVWLQHLYEKVSRKPYDARRPSGAKLDTVDEDQCRSRSIQPPSGVIPDTPDEDQCKLSRATMGNLSSPRSTASIRSKTSVKAKLLIERMRDRSVASDAEKALEADIRATLVVYFLARLPSIEKCLTGRSTEQFQPRTLDRWCRQVFSVLILVVFGFLATEVPYEAVSGWSSALLVGALSMTMAFYLSVACCSGLFVLVRILAMFGDANEGAVGADVPPD